MKSAKGYINGIGLISPQVTFEPESFLIEPREYSTNVLACVTPDFKNYIAPIQLRRLSRLLRIGLSAAVICVRDAQNDRPDGIITSTGYGFLDDTAKFLTELLTQEEKQLTPTYFMQSTYNALGGLVALSLKCPGYNTTHVGKGFAFETALLDGLMQIQTKPALNFLVGGYDETDKVQFAVNTKAGHYKSGNISSLKLFESRTIGSLQGEGAAFFFLSATNNERTWCRLDGIRMLYKPSAQELEDGIQDFLRSNDCTPRDVDVVINGADGDVEKDVPINSTIDALFRRTAQARFKHLCGEFCTASSFAVWMGAMMLKRQEIPEVARANQITPDHIDKVLVVNHYLGRNYTMMLLTQSR